jgi:hypothetical protein
MTTDKKNQHYIPKFYLRNFSYLDNKKQIGVYNIQNGFYFQQSKLKTQGSKNFFYGIDGVIEDSLSTIEGDLSSIIRNIISTKTVPKSGTKEHFDLLLFVVLTDVRNPVKIDGMKNSLNEMRKRLLELDSKTDVDKLVPNPTHNEIIKLLFGGVMETVKLILDLDYKIFINQTSIPFISSDFPIVKYNQFLELKKWPHSKMGYGLTGLQIIIPLNHEILLVFFDKGIYKIGDKKKTTYNITNAKNVNDLNILQFLNCFETIYFNEKATESYIQNIHIQSKKFKKANITKSELSYLIKENDEENKKTIEAGFKNFMVINTTDCETNLKIDGLKIHSKGQAQKLHESLAQLRPHAERLRNKNSC